MAGRLEFSLTPNRFGSVDEIFAFLPSVSVDRRLVAVLVMESDSDAEDLMDQDLVVVSTANDQVVKRFKLSRIHREECRLAIEVSDERKFSRRSAEDLAKLTRKYGKRAAVANAWLSRHRWVPLSEWSSDLAGEDDVRGNKDLEAKGVMEAWRATRGRCVALFGEPRLVVRRDAETLVDRRMERWSYRGPEKYCWQGGSSENAALGVSVYSDDVADLLVFELRFGGGHTGCQAPMPAIHVLSMKRGSCP